MRRIFQLWVLCLAVPIVTACELDQVIETPDIPTAGVRFINAVPDTQALDFRFVEGRVENSAHWNVGFRNSPTTAACVTASTRIQYKPATAGDRRFRIFLSDTIQAAAAQVLKDTVVSLEPGKNYTALLQGSARSGATPPMGLTFVEDNPPDPGAQVAIRVINATGNPIDVRQYPVGSAVPTAVAFASIAPLTSSPYLTVPASRLRLNIQRAGGPASEPIDVLAPAGTPGQVAIDPIPGTNVPGSVITAIVFPARVVGSRGAQTLPFRPSTGASPALQATATGFRRTAGSFLTDCFFVGGRVTAADFANPANRGTFVVTAVTDTSLTVTGAAPTVVERGTTGSTSLSATSTGFARATGSFLADGFVVGQSVIASGFAAETPTTTSNNGTAVVTAVSATELVVTKNPLTVPEAAATGRSIVSALPRTISGVQPTDLVSFVWDRRPPRN